MLFPDWPKCGHVCAPKHTHVQSFSVLQSSLCVLRKQRILRPATWESEPEKNRWSSEMVGVVLCLCFAREKMRGGSCEYYGGRMAQCTK